MRKIPVANVTTQTYLYSKAVAVLEEGGEQTHLQIRDRRGKVLAEASGVWTPAADSSGGGTLATGSGEIEVQRLKGCGCGGTKVTAL